MLVASLLVFASLATATPYSPKGCKILWDGRIPQSQTLQSFDTSSSLFRTDIFLGKDLKWADVLRFPSVPPSLFDKKTPRDSKPLSLSVNDASIYYFNPEFPETGFRRAELVPNTNNGTDATTVGITTMHFSVRTDPAKPLNYSHEYLVGWQERNDFLADHFAVQTGTPFFAGKEDIKIRNPKTLRLVGINDVTPEKNAFITDFTDRTWHNFAITLGFSNNQTTFYYSKNDAPLSRVARFANDFSDQGLYHFGLLKYPIGPPNISIVNEGYQPPIRGAEGLVYGGMFIEDSSNGCVTLS